MGVFFTRMGWGFVLALLDFRVNGFDLLPDAIGYGMLFFALDELAKAFPGYRLPSALAKALAAGAVLELFPGFLASGNDGASLGIPFYYGNAMQLLKLFFVYTCLAAMERHLEGAASEPFLAAVRARRWFYAVVTGAALLAAPFAIHRPEAQAPYVLFFVFMGILAEALVAASFFRAAKEEKDGKPPTSSA